MSNNKNNNSLKNTSCKYKDPFRSTNQVEENGAYSVQHKNNTTTVLLSCSNSCTHTHTHASLRLPQTHLRKKRMQSLTPVHKY